MMNDTCQFCRTGLLEIAYEREWPAAATALICTHCGLVQATHAGSTPFSENVELRCHRARAAIEPIGFYSDLSAELKILDIGAGQGAFVREILNNAPRARVTALEADPRRAWACAFRDRSAVIEKRIEDAEFESESFDIVYSAAFEGIDSPITVLAELRRIMKPDGLLVLDARNISALRDHDGFDEWFRPAYRFHYSPRTLSRMIAAAGFAIVERPDRNDPENILIVAAKCDEAFQDLCADLLEVKSARALVACYRTVCERNAHAMTHLATELNRIAQRGVALCGNSRSFDQFARCGALDPLLTSSRFELRVLEQCSNSTPDRTASEDRTPGVILVLSDSAKSEAGRLAAKTSPKSEIVHYSELLLRAYGAIAA
jgi:SAM-dependent methyltransferase